MPLTQTYNTMNKSIILSLVIALFSSCAPVQHNSQELNNKIAYLLNEGYQPKAAEHIAKVELKLIPEDSEYIALMED